jgi:hypothetical protein
VGRFDASLVDDEYTEAKWRADYRAGAGKTSGWSRDTGALSLRARYNRACTGAQSRGADLGTLRKALHDLRTTVGDEDLRGWARQDPSLAVFRRPTTSQQLRTEYKQLVGDPAPAQLLDLAPFAPHAEKLRAFGVDDASRLLAASPWRLAISLDVALPAVMRWRDVARLAKVTADERGVSDIAALGLLLSLGVESPEALWRRLEEDGEDELYGDLVGEGTDSAYEPKKEDTVRRWKDRRPTVAARAPGPG